MNNFDGEGNEGQQQPGQQMHPQLPPEAPSGSNTVPQNQLTQSIASSAWLFDAIAVNYVYTMQLQEMLRLSGLGFLPEQAPAENTASHAPDAFVNSEVPPARDPSSNPEQTGESTDNGGTVEEALDVENLPENGDQDVQEPVVVGVNETQPVAELEVQNPQEDDEQEPIIICDLSDESSPEPESDDEIKCLGEFIPDNPHRLSFSRVYSTDGQKRAPSSDESKENENRTNEPALSFTKVHSFVVNFDDDSAGGQDAQNLILNPEHDQDASVPENTAVPLVENREPGNEVSFRDEEFLLSLSEAQATESSTDSVINEEIEDPVDSLQNGTELVASNDRQNDLPETPTESGNGTMEDQIFGATTEDGLNVLVPKEDLDEDDLMSQIDPDVCRMAISPITFQEPQEVEMPLEQTGSNQSDEQLLQEDPMQCEESIDPLQASNDDQNDHPENFQPAEGRTDNASSAPMENQETVNPTPQDTCQPQEDQSDDATHSSTGSLQVQAPKSSARLPKTKKEPLPRRLSQKFVSEGGSRNEKMKKYLYPWGQDGFQRTMALWRSQRMWTKNLADRSKMDKSELWSSGNEEPLVAMVKMMLGEEKARLLTESQKELFVQIIKKSKGMIKEQLKLTIEMEMAKLERRKKTSQGNQKNRRNAMKRKYVFADEEESLEANGQRAKRTAKKAKSRL